MNCCTGIPRPSDLPLYLILPPSHWSVGLPRLPLTRSSMLAWSLLLQTYSTHR